MIPLTDSAIKDNDFTLDLNLKRGQWPPRRWPGSGKTGELSGGVGGRRLIVTNATTFAM